LIAVSAGLVADDMTRSTVAHAMNWIYGVNVAFAAVTLIALVPLLAAGRAGARRSKRLSP